MSSTQILRVLFVSDTHLGFDAVKRSRIKRRRRADDFLACYQRALAPALVGEVDAVVHGGDIFDHPNVTAGTVDDAFRPLRRIADLGIPVFVIAGNHERSRIPCPLLSMHPGIHVITDPRTQVVRARRHPLVVGGFSYARDVRQRFTGLLRTSRLLEEAPSEPHVRLLLVHHAIEGAAVSNPTGDFVFRDGHDVIRARDIPSGVAATLSGHLHRHQLLRRWRGTPYGSPVCYPGSVERTSLVERDETKGYVILDLEPTHDGGTLVACHFHELPARPMRLCRLEANAATTVERTVRAAIANAPIDAVLHFRAAAPLRNAPPPILSMPRLRDLAPPTMNITLGFETGVGATTGTRRELRRAALAR